MGWVVLKAWSLSYRSQASPGAFAGRGSFSVSLDFSQALTPQGLLITQAGCFRPSCFEECPIPQLKLSDASSFEPDEPESFLEVAFRLFITG